MKINAFYFSVSLCGHKLDTKELLENYVNMLNFVIYLLPLYQQNH